MGAADGDGAPDAPAAAFPLDQGLHLRDMFKFGWRYVAARKGLSAGYLALSAIEKLAMIGVPVLFGHIVNVINQPQGGDAPGGLLTNLRLLFIAWLVLLVGGLVLGFFREMTRTRLDGLMVNQIRDDVFSSYLRQTPQFFHENEPGRLAVIVNEMSVEAQHAVREIVLDPVIQGIALVGTAAAIVRELMTLYSPSAASGSSASAAWGVVVFALLSSIVALYFINRLGRNLGQASFASRDKTLGIATLVNSALQSPEEVQAFSAEETFRRKHLTALEQLLGTRLQQAAALGRLNAVNGLPVVLVQAVLVGSAIAVVLSAPDGGNAGALVAMVGLAAYLVEPVQTLGAFAVAARTAWPSVEQVQSVLRLDRQPAEGTSAAPADLEPTLEARQVTFRYRPDLPAVLDEVSFVAPAGTRTALVARMGQGKTTFFRLALRFYAPERGEVTIGGTSVAAITVRQLRQQVVMMAQFPAFFHDTVRDNLRLAKPDATDEELIELCRFTGIWPVLQRNVGESREQEQRPNPLDRQFASGKMLGGGHRKLFALTRCLLRQPRILLLDEPTAGMSNDEKYALIPQMVAALEGRTVMIVDHDVRWLAQVCQRAVVLDAGKIVQDGTIAELLSRPGLFKELHDLGGTRRESPRGESDAGAPAVPHDLGTGIAGGIRP